MYGKIVEDKVEIVQELPREIVVDDRRIFNPTMEDCGLVELPVPAPEEGYRFVGYIVQASANATDIVCSYEEISEVVEEEPIAE